MEALPGDAFNQQALRLTAGRSLHLLMAFPLLPQATGGQQQAVGLIRVAETALLLQVSGQVGVIAGRQGNGFGFGQSDSSQPRDGGIRHGDHVRLEAEDPLSRPALCPRSHW